MSETAPVKLSVQARGVLLAAAVMIGTSLSLLYGWSGAFYAVPLIAGVCIEAWAPRVGRFLVGLALMFSFVYSALFVAPFAVLGAFSLGNPASNPIFPLQFASGWAALALLGWAVWEFVRFEDSLKKPYDTRSTLPGTR